MKYVRTTDGRIISANTATHELTQMICDAGYSDTLDKGSYVTIGEEWVNFYGRWVDIIDENGLHYSIRPNKVKEVTRELPQADTIAELCDEFVAINYGINTKPIPLNVNKFETIKSIAKECEVKGAIWTDKGLIYVAKMNKIGELELL